MPIINCTLLENIRKWIKKTNLILKAPIIGTIDNVHSK